MIKNRIKTVFVADEAFQKDGMNLFFLAGDEKFK